MNYGANRRDIDAFISRRSGIEPVVGHPVHDGLPIIVSNILDRWISVLETWPREVPVEVRVCQIEGILAAFAFSARRVISLTEKTLGEPEGKTLFPDPPGTVEQQACRKGSGFEGSGKAFLEVFVPVEARKRHGVIWHVS